jgi:hypothetical protein
MKSTFVIYHANCPDGFAAAFVAALFFGDDVEKTGPVSFVPASYGDAVPGMPDGCDVFILDFSYSREVLMELSKRCMVRVLDHHGTAQKALEGLEFATFDMRKSGAVLTWEYFYPGVSVPELLLYVQDRDLWQWQLPNSKAINAALWRGTPRVFGCWKDLLYLWDKGVTTAKERLIQAGEAIAFSDDLMVQNLCRAPAWVRVLFYKVPAVNSAVLQSEIGHQLLIDHPHAPFALIWWIMDDGEPTFSLRSREGDFDVSKVAGLFGGGGHKAAAGFRRKRMFEFVTTNDGEIPFDEPLESCKLTACHTGDGWALALEVTTASGHLVAMLDWPKAWPETVTTKELQQFGFEVV